MPMTGLLQHGMVSHWNNWALSTHKGNVMVLFNIDISWGDLRWSRQWRYGGVVADKGISNETNAGLTFDDQANQQILKYIVNQLERLGKGWYGWQRWHYWCGFT